MINHITFGGQKYNFLQNQTGLPCAYCGGNIVSEKDMKLLRRCLEGKKGIEIAQILTPYLGFFADVENEPIYELVNLAKNPRYSNVSLKNLALHLKKRGVYSTDTNQLIHNLFEPVLYSVEHTVPRSEGGKNSYSNYLPMHRICNSSRSSDSYQKVFIENPKFVENINKALHEITSRILSDRAGLTHYGINLPEDYAVRVAESIASQGIPRELIILA